VCHAQAEEEGPADHTAAWGELSLVVTNVAEAGKEK
jgi:hypothetical protein